MRRRDSPLFDRSGSEVLRSARSWDDVIDGLRYAKLKDDELIHVIALGSAAPVAEALAARTYVGLRHVGHHGNLDTFSYARTVGKRKPHRFSGEFVVTRWNDSKVYFVACCSSPAYVREALAPLLERTYSKIVRPFLSQGELEELLRTLQKGAEPGVLRLHEYSAKRRLKSARRKYESMRDWTDADPQSAFAEARERNVWFRSVRFEIVRPQGAADAGQWGGLHGRLSKYGDVSVDSGFDLVERIVLPFLAEITEKRLRLFSNRDRASAPRHGVRPLEIAYDQPLFKSPDDLKRLLESLRRFPHGTCTVLHGNPYPARHAC